MTRTIAAALAVAVALPFAVPAEAQSVSRERTRETTTTTRDGNTTTTTTRSTTVGGSASVDAGALGEALAGALLGQTGRREPDWRRRAEPARPQDVFGAWLADDGGRDVGGCRMIFGERGFLGVRGVETEDCPSRLARISNWRVENGEVLLFRGPSDQNGPRLSLVEGRLLGDGLMLRREGDDGPGPMADAYDHRADDRRGGGGWGAPPQADAYAGTWRHIEIGMTGQRRECTVRLTTNPAFGALQGSASGCFEDLMFVNSWRLEDRQVVLYKAGGGTVAILRGGPNRLSGRTPEGEEIVLYR
ncbi:AprI/Inh family metalloprotease inhibitor [Brevundimonas viscosa]|uniref:Protease inhibitor Inh n=1 Tax=Brevundimonas viscosa TaxID=871741 RepID=A0A1I6S3H0_9CAUL|nr:AprI/Inh family metalloprotease inhibitor [Brevundimonas viscosa]SFS71511.1 Protease inhibitor Inh [Brevundimonas viscosa]